MTRRTGVTRRRKTQRNRTVRLRPVERLLFILGATLYLVGVFGGVGLLPMPTNTAMILLGVGGGVQLAVTLSLVF